MRDYIDSDDMNALALWTQKTFGPVVSVTLAMEGVVDHIKKELVEIEADPTDVEEWIDVMTLAMSGAMKCGATPKEVIHAWHLKMAKNQARQWPDWRTSEPGKAIEHIR